jgi:hypothetical protein
MASNAQEPTTALENKIKTKKAQIFEYRNGVMVID